MKLVDIEFVVVVGTFLQDQFDNTNGKNKRSPEPNKHQKHQQN